MSPRWYVLLCGMLCNWVVSPAWWLWTGIHVDEEGPWLSQLSHWSEEDRLAI